MSDRYAALFANLPSGLIVYHLEDPADDRTLRLVECNPRAAELRGVRVEDVMGRTIDENFPGLRQHGVPHVYAEVVRTGRPAVIEQVKYDDARVRDVAFRVKAFPMPGQCVGIAFENITERELLEQELIGLHALEQAILESADFAIVSTDLHGTLLTFNRTAERLLGHRADELVGRASADIFHDGAELEARAHELSAQLGVIVQTPLDVFVALVSESRADTREWTWVRKDGARVALQVSITAMRDRLGQLLGFLFIGTDISAHKRAEESRARLLAIIENTTDVVATGDLEGRSLFFNHAARRTLGLADDEDLAGLKNIDFFPERLRDEVRERVRQAMREGVWVGETLLRARDGTEIPVSQLILAHRDARGNPLYVSTVARDITDRKRAEAQLQEREAKLQAILNAAADAIFTTDEQARVESFNPAAERIFGYRAAEVIGRSILDLVAEPSRSEYEQYRRAYLKTGIKQIQDQEREIVAIRRDGSTFPASLVIGEIITGGKRSFTCILRDITERKQLDRMKNEFVSTVSHELRTPLTSIRGSLGLLEGGVVGVLPDAALDLVRVAHTNTERLIRLINDILDLEKMEAGRLELHVKPFDPVALVAAAVEGIRGMATHADVELSSDVRVQANLRGDWDRLIQVLTNLLSNAIKFSPHGGRVSVLVDWVGARVRFTVSDQGPGIPAAQRTKLFGKFQQLDASDGREKGGSGLGLAISKAIVEQHGGLIGVESAPGSGAAFWFELPAAARAGAPQPPALAALADEYRRGLTAKVEALRAAVRELDLGRASELAHRLNGTAGSYGFHEVGEAAGRIEEAIKVAGAAEIDRRLAILEDAVGRAGT